MVPHQFLRFMESALGVICEYTVEKTSRKNIVMQKDFCWNSGFRIILSLKFNFQATSIKQ